MSESKDRKTLWLAIAGAGLLVGAALIFHWANQAEEEEGVDIAAALKEAGLMEVKKQGPLLEPRYFLSLLQFVGENTQLKLSKVKKELDAERRKHYTEKNDSGYSDCVLRLI
jgi:hypothetical protein